MNPPPAILAVDIGNSRIKLGRFDQVAEGDAAHLVTCNSGLPEPSATLALAPETGEFDFAPLRTWLADQVGAPAQWVVGSVCRPAAEQLREFFHASDPPQHTWRELSHADLPIANRTAEPDRVGIDRLAAAVAADAIRRVETPAVVIDFGTAVTVDLVSADGAFEGGAILPGLEMAAEALHTRTDALPKVELGVDAQSPSAVGRSTVEAIQAGLYWGTVGALRELIARQSDRLVVPPQVLVTGGTSPEWARLLGSPTYTVRYVPHLVLAGLALTACCPAAERDA